MTSTTLSTYQKDALRTLSHVSFVNEVNPHLIHAAMGLCTEAGELLDAIKRRAFYGAPIDEVNVKEELGDLMWYIAVACEAIGITIDDACKSNVDKLKRRFPKSFTTGHATHRNLDAERAALEGVTSA